MDFITYKGRPLTRSLLADINALFGCIDRKRAIPPKLEARLKDAGVTLPALLPPP